MAETTCTLQSDIAYDGNVDAGMFSALGGLALGDGTTTAVSCTIQTISQVDSSDATFQLSADGPYINLITDPSIAEESVSYGSGSTAKTLTLNAPGGIDLTGATYTISYADGTLSFWLDAVSADAPIGTIDATGPFSLDATSYSDAAGGTCSVGATCPAASSPDPVEPPSPVLDDLEIALVVGAGALVAAIVVAVVIIKS